MIIILVASALLLGGCVSPIHDAALKGDLAKINDMLTKGTDINALDDKGRVALHKAAELEDSATAKLLIDKGADVNVKAADNGAAPLHTATFHGRLMTSRLLIDAGADVNV